MSRISIPVTIADAPQAAQPLLKAVSKMAGSVLNLFRLVANNSSVLKGYLAISGALGMGDLPVAARQRIALVVAELNRCGYCLSVCTYMAMNLASLSADQVVTPPPQGRFE